MTEASLARSMTQGPHSTIGASGEAANYTPLGGEGQGGGMCVCVCKH